MYFIYMAILRSEAVFFTVVLSSKEKDLINKSVVSVYVLSTQKLKNVYGKMWT